MKKILGIGSALVDILTHVDDDDTLKQLSLPKGSMQLVSADEAAKINNALAISSTMAAGGSAANTISGLAKMGIEAGFLGVVGNDEIGRFFETEMIKTGVTPLLVKTNTPSGRVQAIVTPDSERTFATYLGASQELSAQHITTDKLKDWDILYVEGYLVSNTTMLDHALTTAKQNGMKIAIDLASYNVVADNRNYLLKMIKNYADIVFANQEEAHALTGLDPENALDNIASMCDIAVVKVGKDGSMAKRGNEKVTIQPIRSTVIDTTGAGDMFAAGFLAALVQGHNLTTCGNTGAILASNIIEVTGAKMDDERWNKIHQQIKKL